MSTNDDAIPAPDKPSEASPVRRYLTKRELAAATGLSETTIQRYKEAGVIRCFQPAGKGARVFFPNDAIEAAGIASQKSHAISVDLAPAHEARLMKAKLPGPRPRWLDNSKLI
jgi:hypothetical protein